MPTRGTGFALCIENRGAEDLDIRKVYRVIEDRAATEAGYLRVIDESGEDYLYPTDYFVFIKLPQKARRALTVARRSASRQRSPNKPLQRSGARVARSGR